MSSPRRRVVVPEPDIITIEKDFLADPAPGDVNVRMIVSGICGSDKAGAHGEHAFFKPPYHPGHEVVGEVVQLGEGVNHVAVGDRVTVEPTLPCGRCKMCATQRENLCENLEFFGCGHPEGGMADYFTVRADRLHRVPVSFSAHQAALIEPLATPVHAVRLAGDIEGKTVAILGAGTIALLLMAVVRSKGARKIVVTDVLENKRQLALRLGADSVLDARRPDLRQAARRELGESADVVFDCVAHEQTVGVAIDLAVKGGTVVVVGGARRLVTVDLPRIQEFQIRLQGAATYLAEDYADAIELIAAGRVRSEDFVTATFPLTQAAAAFASIASGEQVKILVTAEPEST